MNKLICPQCNGKDFKSVDCGPDGWDDDITYISQKCKKCGLWYDGWNCEWYINVSHWQEVEKAKQYQIINYGITTA